MFSFDQSAESRQRKLASRDDSANLREQMTRSADTQTTRELAQRLLAYEAGEAEGVMPDTQAVCRVCDNLRRPLTTLAGAAGFRLLLTRSLTLAKRESPILGAWEVKPDGSLQGLNDETAKAGAVLITELIGLMLTLIGEPLTLRLLHNAWPSLPASEVNFERNELK